MPEPHDNLCMSCGAFLGQCHDEDCDLSDHHYSNAEERCADCTGKCCDHAVMKGNYCSDCDQGNCCYDPAHDCMAEELHAIWERNNRMQLRRDEFESTLPTHL